MRRGAMIAILVAAMLDVAANYLAARVMLSAGPLLIPGGTLVFALGFTTYDYIRRTYGWQATLAAIGLGFVVSVASSLIFGGGMGTIALAGLAALACSSTTDYAIQSLTLRWPIWSYIASCNAVSLAIDTVVFGMVAFAPLPFSVRLHIMAGQYVGKITMTALSIPLVYWVRSLTPRPQAVVA